MNNKPIHSYIFLVRDSYQYPYIYIYKYAFGQNVANINNSKPYAKTRPKTHGSHLQKDAFKHDENVTRKTQFYVEHFLDWLLTGPFLLSVLSGTGSVGPSSFSRGERQPTKGEWATDETDVVRISLSYWARTEESGGVLLGPRTILLGHSLYHTSRCTKEKRGRAEAPSRAAAAARNFSGRGSLLAGLDQTIWTITFRTQTQCSTKHKNSGNKKLPQCPILDLLYLENKIT